MIYIDDLISEMKDLYQVKEGYMQIFAGAMQGIRNPKAHENLSISREDAVKRLVLASLLMDKIDEAISFTNLSEF